MNYGPPFYTENATRPSQNAVINNYTILKELYETNSSIVYKGLDTVNNGYVILNLKKLKERKVSTIQDQIDVLNFVHHPNIITLIECFRYAEYVCFVFPYIQAGTLHEFIIINYPDGIPEFLASKIMRQLLEAANYLHSNNIIHNGINPSNILIDNADPVNFHILLSGTGFSKILEPGQLEDKFRGTPEYMAPEIYKHESYDINVDTWSLGITLFVLLSGRYPFPNFRLQPRRTINSELNYTLLVDKNISPEAIDLIRQMCREDPISRISDADVLNHTWIQ